MFSYNRTFVVALSSLIVATGIGCSKKSGNSPAAPAASPQAETTKPGEVLTEIGDDSFDGTGGLELDKDYAGEVLTLVAKSPEFPGQITLVGDDAKALYMALKIKPVEEKVTPVEAVVPEVPVVDSEAQNEGTEPSTEGSTEPVTEPVVEVQPDVEVPVVMVKQGRHLKCIEKANPEAPNEKLYECLININYGTGHVITTFLQTDDDSSVANVKENYSGKNLNLIASESETLGTIGFTGEDAKVLFNTLGVETEGMQPETGFASILKKQGLQVGCVERTTEDAGNAKAYTCSLEINYANGDIKMHKVRGL